MEMDDMGSDAACGKIFLSDLRSLHFVISSTINEAKSGLSLEKVLKPITTTNVAVTPPEKGYEKSENCNQTI